MFKDLIKGIKNLIYFLPVVWTDREWDYSYFEELMYKKLLKDYKFYSGALNYMSEEKQNKMVVKPLALCLKIMERRRNDWYTSTWHSVNFPNGSELEFIPTENEMFEMKLNKETLYDFHHPTKGLAAFDKASQRDLKILHNIIAKYLEYWWE